MGSPRSTERNFQSSRDRGAHAAPLNFAYEVARAQRAIHDGNQTITRRRGFDGRFGAYEDRCAGGVPGIEEGATSPRLINCVGCRGSYRGPLALVAPAGCRIPTTTTRERPFVQRHRRGHGVCTEGILLLSVGDRGGGNGLRPLFVRETGVAASGRPFSGSGLDSRDLYALC